MADKIRAKVLRQKVFHDGSSMVVLNPKDRHIPKVEPRFLQGLVDEGIIADPGTAVLRASQAAAGFTDGGDIKGVGDDTLSQPIGAFTEEQERSLAEQSQALGGDDESELDELYDRLAERDRQLDELQASHDALITERDELLIQLNEAHDQLASFDQNGNGTAGGSTAPGGDDVPALRQEYETVLGKKPFPGWGADELRKRIADHKAGEGTGAEDEAPAS